MAYSYRHEWSAGDELTAARLNNTGPSPVFLYWAGHLFGDTSYTNAVVTADGRYLLGAATTSWEIHDAVHAGAPWPRNDGSQETGLTITPTVSCRAEETGGTEYIIAYAAGGTAGYRYDNDGSSEASITVSGTDITTGAQRIGWDPGTGYVYIMDGADKAATAVKRYTFTGSTLTYVDTITLGTAPGSTGEVQMFIGDNYLCIDDSANNATVDIRRYGKDSGTQIDDNPFGGWGGSTQTMFSFVHPNKEYYVMTETVNDNTEALKAVKWTLDDLSQ